jgi:hypothetical protein
MGRLENAVSVKFAARFVVFCLALAATVPCFGAASGAAFPTGLTFNPQLTGTVSGSQTVSVYNLGTTVLTVTAATSSVPQFVVSGTFPVSIQPAQWANFTVTFNPSLAKSFNGTLSFAVTGLPAGLKSTLSGLGTSATAKASVSVTSLNLGSTSLGNASPTQSVTITNTGTSSFKVTAVTLTPPFMQTGFSGVATTIAKGGSLKMQVSFFPTATGVTNGTMLLNYDSLAPSGLSLTGTGVAPTALAATTYPTLPSGSQNSAYQATLTALGGTPPYSFALASGSALPNGLSLSSSGLITGSFNSVAVGNYSFTVTTTDSASGSVNQTLTLPIAVATGAVCNNIIFPAGDGSGPLVPLNDLGTGSYLGAEQGGLYNGGTNIRPSAHDASGITLAQGLQPLDSNGNPSPTGKMVFISIGESVAQQPFIEFMSLTGVDPSINKSLVIVNGANGGATASDMAAFKNNFWNVITNNVLPNAGVTPRQVVAAWINDVNGGPSGTFPTDMTKLQGNYESIAQNLFMKFPNIKLAYFSTINYAGYSNGIKNLSNEPWSYETGFAVKNAIQDQINGNANLNFDPTKGAVKAPWIDWGPYYWANGMQSRNDGLVWTCQDLQADGTHPSTGPGRLKVSTQMLNFLKSDDTASIWFLAH